MDSTQLPIDYQRIYNKINKLNTWLCYELGLTKIFREILDIKYNKPLSQKRIIDTYNDLKIVKLTSYPLDILNHRMKNFYDGKEKLVTDSNDIWQPTGKQDTNYSSHSFIITLYIKKLIEKGKNEMISTGNKYKQMLLSTNNDDDIKNILMSIKNDKWFIRHINSIDLNKYNGEIIRTTKMGEESEEIGENILLKIESDILARGGNGVLIDKILGIDFIIKNLKLSNNPLTIQCKSSKNDKTIDSYRNIIDILIIANDNYVRMYWMKKMEEIKWENMIS